MTRLQRLWTRITNWFRKAPKREWPDAWIQNISFHDVTLEGPVLRRLLVRTGQTVKIDGPVKEAIFVSTESTRDFLARTVGRGIGHPPGKMKVTNWDAFEVAKDLVEQWALSLGDNQTMIYRIRPGGDRDDFIRKLVDVCGLKAYQEDPGPVIMYH